MTQPAGFGPAYYVDGPPPQAPAFSLVKTARIVPETDEHWINGVKVHGYPPDVAHIHDACSSGTNRVKATGGAIPVPEFGALNVYFAETCTAAGIYGRGMSDDDVQARYVARAIAALTAVESAALETEFMAGSVLGNNPHLADGTGTITAVAVDVTTGIGLLENDIAASGRRGVIHCSPALAIKATQQRLLHQDGDVLRTILGTPVVPGDGYVGKSRPTGGSPAPSATQEYVYATGPVDMRRTEPIIIPENFSEALDRGANTVTYLVERYYVVDWDTAVHSARLIDRST